MCPARSHSSIDLTPARDWRRMHTHSLESMHAHAHSHHPCTHTPTHIIRANARARMCTHVHARGCTCTHAHASARMCTHVHACVHACMHVHGCAHMCTHVYLRVGTHTVQSHSRAAPRTRVRHWLHRLHLPERFRCFQLSLDESVAVGHKLRGIKLTQQLRHAARRMGQE